MADYTIKSRLKSLMKNVLIFFSACRPFFKRFPIVLRDARLNSHLTRYQTETLQALSCSLRLQHKDKGRTSEAEHVMWMEIQLHDWSKAPEGKHYPWPILRLLCEVGRCKTFQ